MASLQQTLSSPLPLGQRSSAKPAKPRSGTAVKPILKKLHSPSLSLSHPDRESLDLDRGWDDQPSPRLAPLGRTHGLYDADAGPCHPHHPRSPRDVSFSLAPSDLGAAAGVGRIKYSHARSASGASHVSIATTNSGCRNGGSFIHPFQQTPQPSVLPLSYSRASSRASLDNASATGPRDSSPAITEDGDDFDPYSSFHSASASSAGRPPVHNQQRRPSLPPVPDGTQALRPTAIRSYSSSTQRPAPGSVRQSRSELQLGADSRSQLVTAAATISSAAPMSPLRHSLDMGGFRLRSRSEVDTATRQEQIREARRKFEARERAKEEKYAREQIRKRERADSKEAQRLEREQARVRKASHASLSSGTGSNGAPRIKGAKGVGPGGPDEKATIAGCGYDPPTPRQARTPKAANVEFKSSKRSKAAKHKTMSVWTSFMLWLRTRLLKLGRR